MKVTLQLPMTDHTNRLLIFRREVDLPVLFPGLLLSGKNIPMLMPTGSVATQVVEVAYDLDNDRTYATVIGSREPTYNAEELLAQLGEGWSVAKPITPPELQSDEDNLGS